MSTNAKCNSCKYSIVNNNTGEYCPFYVSNNYRVCKNNKDFVQHIMVPKSSYQCRQMYPDTSLLPEGICEKCNQCEYRPTVLIITPSRFYTPPCEDEMTETEPIVFSVGE